MAQKRMFDKKVTDSDKFADLPNTSKALYFMAGMGADDRGFFQPRRLQKEYGFTDDDFKILIAKGYFICFESGVMVVTDWNKNNWLDNRRITETEYIDELHLLELVNGKYELNPTDKPCLAHAKPMLSQYSIEENSIEENSNNIVNKVDTKYQELLDTYNKNCTNLPKVLKLTAKRRSAIRTFLKEYSKEDFETICKKANNNSFLTGSNNRHWTADFDFLLRVDKATKILEENYSNVNAENESNSKENQLEFLKGLAERSVT